MSTTQRPRQRIYINPDLAADDKLDIERMRRFYAARNIDITTDATDKDGNTRDQRTPQTRAAWLEAMRASKSGIKREKVTGPRTKAEPPTGKVCTTCGEHKTFDQFVVSPKGRILWTCTACFSARANATERTCPRCGETKPLSKFAHSRNSVGGRTKTCSLCRSRARSPRYRGAKGIPGDA